MLSEAVSNAGLACAGLLCDFTAPSTDSKLFLRVGYRRCQESYSHSGERNELCKKKARLVSIGIACQFNQYVMVLLHGAGLGGLMGMCWMQATLWAMPVSIRDHPGSCG